MKASTLRLLVVLRSIAAVLVGYLVFAVGGLAFFQLTGADPARAPDAGFLVASVVVGALLAAAAGYLTAALAGRWELGHAAVLAGLTAVFAVASMTSHVGKEPVWSQVAALLVMVPAVLVGGWLRARRGHGRRGRTHT